MVNESEFGIPRNENFYEKYIGEWMLFRSHNDWEAGNLCKIEEGYVILNPHQGRGMKEGKLIIY